MQNIALDLTDANNIFLVIVKTKSTPHIFKLCLFLQRT